MAITHLIPGYALDRRVLECLRLPEPQFRCADLIPPERQETLEGYARRLAGAIGFQSGDAVGGVSLGGMLALEIARQCGASKIFLVASCTHPRFIRLPFRVLGRLARWVPEPALHHLFAGFPWAMRRMGMHTDAGEALLRDVMGRFPPALLRRLPSMMLDWKGCEPAAPCAALHCEGDWLIRPPRHLPELTLLPGRNHLLSISHHDATRAFFLENSAG
jgi:hypothetical protein